MEEQTNLKPTETFKRTKTIWTIILSVVVTTIVVGGGTYLWGKLNLKLVEQKLQQQTILLQDKTRELQKEKSKQETLKHLTPTSSSKTTDVIQLPVIAYGRPGLLNNTKEGLIEKKNLEEKLINPYVDYYNENEVNIVSMYIIVPRNIGEEYEVIAILKNGTNGFLFGKREQEYDYWNPECLERCNFSETFKVKYPQIVEKNQ